MKDIKKYDLYKDDYTRLHFQINDAVPYCKANKAHCYRPHQHSFYQFIWFRTEGQHYVDYEVISHKANTLFFLDKSQVHTFCKDSPNDGVLYHFDELFLNRQGAESDSWVQQKIFNGIGDPYLELDDSSIDFFHTISSQLGEEMLKKERNYSHQVYHLFHSLIMTLERLKYAELGSTQAEDSNLQLLVSFKKLIQEHIHSTMSIDQYSELLAVSSKKLTDISKTYLHDTPHNVIKKRKLLEAKRLLSNTNISITELAYKLGFDQPTYFTKYFKKETGLTPKDFARQIR